MDGVDCATKPQKPVIYQGLSLLWGVNSCVIDGVLSSVSVRWCRGFRVSGVVFCMLWNGFGRLSGRCVAPSSALIAGGMAYFTIARVALANSL